MSETPHTPGGRVGNGAIEWRLRRVEDDVRELEKGQPAVIAERTRQLELRVGALNSHVSKRIDDLEAGQNALQRAIVGAAVAFAGSALIFSFTVWQVFG